MHEFLSRRTDNTREMLQVGSFGGKRAFTARQPQYDPDVSFSKELVKLLRHGVYPSISIRSGMMFCFICNLCTVVIVVT